MIDHPNKTLVVGACLKMIPNQYDMTIAAAARARDIKFGKGQPPMVDVGNDKPTTTALKEIAAGLVGKDYKTMIFDERK